MSAVAEEVLSGNKALWFSPDGARLAYVTYDDTAVPFMTLPYYGRPGELLFQYTRAYNIRYPKVRRAVGRLLWIPMGYTYSRQ